MIGNNGKQLMVAKTYQGLEQVLASELQALGAQDIQVLNQGVLFFADKALVYACNLRLRTATRVLLRLSEFNARNWENYSRSITHIDWSEIMGLKDSLAVDVSTNSELFQQGSMVAFKTREAIVDQFSKKTGRKPNTNVDHPTVRIHVHIHDRDCGIYLDTGCEGLHWRGWRKGKEDGHISDALAAGMLLLSGWQGEIGLVDGQCGTGQLCAEAAMISANIAPGISRDSFGFQRWKDYDADLFKAQRAIAIGLERPMPATIQGWNRSQMEINMAHRQLTAAGVNKLVDFEKTSMQKNEAKGLPRLLFIRPEDCSPLALKALFVLLQGQFKDWQVIVVGPEGDGFKEFKSNVAKRNVLLDGKRAYQWVRLDLKEYQRQQS